MIIAVWILAVGALFLAMVGGCEGRAWDEPPPAGTRTAPSSTPAPTETAGDGGGSLPVVTPTRPHPSPTERATVVAAEPAEGFPAPPERDLYRLARELIPGIGDVGRVEGAAAPALAVGARRSFELVDLRGLERYQSEFELRLVTPQAYWFVEDGIEVAQDVLEQSASEFEDTIYPLVTAAYGSEWKPGVDGDPRLYVLNADLKLVGGYYSPADEYPQEIRPTSNEIEAIYINVRQLPVGSAVYGLVLAHELQHAIHWNADPTEESWVNEGLSELAETIARQTEGVMTSMSYFRRAAPTSLTVWPTSDTLANYGAASQFMHYLTEHYGGRSDLRPLLSQQADGIAGIDDFLQAGGYEARFTDVFRDWAVANLLDEDGGIYGYGDLEVSLPVYREIRNGAQLDSSIPQFATEYVRLDLPDSPATLSFQGNADAPLLPVAVDGGCWWGNKGDTIDATLTARADLRGVGQAALDYQIWFAIEEDWDYAYLEVSADGGETWQIIETPHTSSGNPVSSAFGPGYTGHSDRWLDESVSLNQWAGQEIMLRFQYITDAAVHDHGLCLRDLKVSGPDGAAVAAEWRPNGFVWIGNLVRQNFIVQVIYQGRDGADNRVIPLNLGAANRGEITLEPDANARRIVLAVQSMAPATRLPATYTLSLETAE